MATIQQLVGRWRLVESKGFDEYMKELGEAPGWAVLATWLACVRLCVCLSVLGSPFAVLGSGADVLGRHLQPLPFPFPLSVPTMRPRIPRCSAPRGEAAGELGVRASRGSLDSRCVPPRGAPGCLLLSVLTSPILLSFSPSSLLLPLACISSWWPHLAYSAASFVPRWQTSPLPLFSGMRCL